MPSSTTKCLYNLGTAMECLCLSCPICRTGTLLAPTTQGCHEIDYIRQSIQNSAWCIVSAASCLLFVSIPPRVFSHHEHCGSDVHGITSLAHKLFFPLPASLSTLLDRASLSTVLATPCFCPSPAVPSYHHLSLGKLK